MRQKLVELIDKYEKKMRLPVDSETLRYYSGKKKAYEHAIILLDATEVVN
ncbi:hypothetical protein [Bacillus phage 1_ICo-2020]|uniref:Uncharacterized protein n=1 Tax=Bacillus phage 1_ICo-2020 TaxID=2759272 RepID=A0A7G8AKE8_9CAUD|nr:hypothetical protein [Bacillus phage 1_ICo-2020]